MDTPQWIGLLKTQMEEVAGNWNGDDAGIQEDNAHIAELVIIQLEKIEQLLKDIR